MMKQAGKAKAVIKRERVFGHLRIVERTAECLEVPYEH